MDSHRLSCDLHKHTGVGEGMWVYMYVCVCVGVCVLWATVDYARQLGKVEWVQKL